MWVWVSCEGWGGGECGREHDLGGVFGGKVGGGGNCEANFLDKHIVVARDIFEKGHSVTGK